MNLLDFDKEYNEKYTTGKTGKVIKRRKTHRGKKRPNTNAKWRREVEAAMRKHNDMKRSLKQQTEEMNERFKHLIGE